MWPQITLNFFNPKFSYFFFEIKYKIIYFFFSWFLTTICCYFYIHPILYLFSTYLLEHMQSNKFFFSNLIDIIYIYLKISGSISFYICIPFLILNFIIFFFSSLFKHEIFFLLKIFSFFSFWYIFSFFFFFKFFLPLFIDTLLIFENKNLFFSLFFEAKFDEYFFTIIWVFFYFTLLFQIPVIYYLLIFFNVINKNIFFNYKTKIYLILFFFNSFVNPLDFFTQIYFYFIIIFNFEIFFFFFFYKKFGI